MKRKIDADVAIVGGGIVGCAAAYYLAKRDVSVVLIERSVVGGEASGRNAGGVRAQCRNRSERLLAMASIELWKGLETELGFDVEYVQGGNIRLATTEERMDDLRSEGEEELAAGLHVEVWEQDEVRRRAPYLSDIFIGAKYCATDGVANPLLVPRAFGWAAGRIGVQVLEHTEALDVEVRGGRVAAVHAQCQEGELVVEAPWLIHAAGPWSSELSQTLDVDLPIHPLRVVLAVTQPVAPFFTEFLSSHDLKVYARPARSRNIHLGLHGDRDTTFDKRTPPEALCQFQRVIEMVPCLRGIDILRTWSGTLAVTPDGLPIIGTVDGIEGYVLATGFSGHGFCLGPIVGRLLSERIVDGRPSMPLDEFRPSRFQHRVETSDSLAFCSTLRPSD